MILSNKRNNGRSNASTRKKSQSIKNSHKETSESKEIPIPKAIAQSNNKIHPLLQKRISRQLIANHKPTKRLRNRAHRLITSSIKDSSKSSIIERKMLKQLTRYNRKHYFKNLSKKIFPLCFRRKILHLLMIRWLRQLL